MITHSGSHPTVYSARRIYALRREYSFVIELDSEKVNGYKTFWRPTWDIEAVNILACPAFRGGYNQTPAKLP